MPNFCNWPNFISPSNQVWSPISPLRPNSITLISLERQFSSEDGNKWNIGALFSLEHWRVSHILRAQIKNVPFGTWTYSTVFIAIFGRRRLRGSEREWSSFELPAHYTWTFPPFYPANGEDNLLCESRCEYWGTGVPTEGRVLSSPFPVFPYFRISAFPHPPNFTFPRCRCIHVAIERRLHVDDVLETVNPQNRRTNEKETEKWGCTWRSGI